MHTLETIDLANLDSVNGGNGDPPTGIGGVFERALDAIDSPAHTMRDVAVDAWKESEKSVMNGDSYLTSVGKTLGAMIGWR